MTKRYDAILAAPILIAFFLAGWWFSDDDAEAPVAPAAPEVSTKGREVVRARVAARTPAPDDAEAPSPTEVEQALEEMDLPGASLLRCPTTLADGLYEVGGELMKDVRYVTVSGGQLHAAVWADEGRAELAQQTLQVGWLSWSDAGEGWASCEVERPERVTVSGQVHFADDATSGHAITGCIFGDAVDLDDDGRFELAAYIGRTCGLYVVRTSGDRFGKGAVVYVEVEGDVDGVEVHGPADDDMLGAAAQDQLAAALASMTDGRLLELAERERPELDLDDPALAPLLQAWAEQDDGRQVAMADHADALLDPEQQQQALLDAFLGLY